MDAERTGPERARRHGPRRGTAGRKPGRQGRGMRVQRRSPEGVPPTATLPSVDPDYGTALPGDMKTRLARLDWRGIERSLWQWGYAKTTPVLSPSESGELMGLYADERRFRST